MQVLWNDTGAVLATTIIDGAGSFSVPITIPADTRPGAHQVQFFAVQSRFFAVNTFTVDVTPNSDPTTNPTPNPQPPDLKPTAITFGSSALVVGNKIHFDSGIKNVADEDTDVFNIKWLVDGKDVGAYGSHAGIPGHTLVMNGNSQFDWTFDSPGSHSIKFTVDVDNHVSESNENNNSQSATVTLRAKQQQPNQDTIERFFQWLNACVEGRLEFDPGCRDAALDRAGLGRDPASVAGCLKDLADARKLGTCLGGKGFGLWEYWSTHYGKN